MKTATKLWIVIGILALLSPLGIILPKMVGAGGAWGEWGLPEIEKAVGFVPEGMKRVAELWKAPLPDYALPHQGKGLLAESFGYVLSAIIGIVFTAGVMYLLTKLLGRKSGTK
ncbi:MAG TPA: PDGLE domain-containing protein [Nitrospirota bacterium]|nr:PDGLE domain-containing protein [Nitrospirota bacterium]